MAEDQPRPPINIDLSSFIKPVTAALLMNGVYLRQILAELRKEQFFSEEKAGREVFDLFGELLAAIDKEVKRSETRIDAAGQRHPPIVLAPRVVPDPPPPDSGPGTAT